MQRSSKRRPHSQFLTLCLAAGLGGVTACSSGGAGTPGTGSGGGNGSGGATAGSGGADPTGSGGAPGSGGQTTTPDASGSGGATVPVDAAGDSGGTADTGGDRPVPSGNFSFFVTSLEAMRRLSKSQNGFGGDLRYGEADGLAGADKICTEIAESSMPGAGAKGWHAFLSAAKGPAGTPVNAIDRLGNGPWYDRQGRLVAMTKAALLNNRPQGAAPAILNDLPNEFGIPNHRPDPTMPEADNHHVMTGSDTMGRLFTGQPDSTCQSWTTSSRTSGGRPRIGFSWIAGGRVNWISGQDEGGCGAGVAIEENGPADPSNPIVGSGGGYGGIYCFASAP